MKAITVWQPWASLLVSGRKRYETRSWATSYRGPIAIHAAKRPVRQTIDALVADRGMDGSRWTTLIACSCGPGSWTSYLPGLSWERRF